MQPALEIFLKNFLRRAARAYTLEFTIIEIEQRYINRTIDNASGMYYKNTAPLYQKLYPHV